MNKEAIELLTKDVAFWDNDGGKIAQIPREDYDQALAILKEQPLAGDLMKEAIELDKMCVSEIVAKYESSHNAIAVLKRKFREACESDEWRKSATEFYENGGCPICFSTDEAGCTEGCYLGQLQAKLAEQPPAGDFINKMHDKYKFFKFRDSRTEIGRDLVEACTRLDRSEAGERILEERIEKLSDTLDRSEASREELLTALKRISDIEDERYTHSGFDLEVNNISKAAIAKSNKENAEKRKRKL